MLVNESRVHESNLAFLGCVGTLSAIMSNESQLLIPLHVSYIKALGDVRSAIVYRDLSNENEQNKVDLAYHMTTHLRMNAIYWV